MENLKVVILYGGWSDERYYTANKEVAQAIDEIGLDYISITINDEPWVDKVREYDPDLVFITNQGNYGEDGKIQAVLDILGIRYIGSGVCPSALVMNKYIFKKVVDSFGVKTPKYMIQRRNRDILDYNDICDYLGEPFIVKPVSNGASFGVNLIGDKNEYNKIFEVLLKQYGDILIEEYIDHPKKEMGIGVIDISGKPAVLPACIIDYKADFFSNEVKFSGEDVVKKFESDTKRTEKGSELSLMLYEELGCSGLARFDFIITEKDELYLLEVNTLPGMLTNSIFPSECEEAGISYKDMVEVLIKSAFSEKPYEVSKIMD